MAWDCYSIKIVEHITFSTYHGQSRDDPCQLTNKWLNNGNVITRYPFISLQTIIVSIRFNWRLSLVNRKQLEILGSQYCHCPNMELISRSQKVKWEKSSLIYNYPKPIWNPKCEILINHLYLNYSRCFVFVTLIQICWCSCKYFVKFFLIETKLGYIYIYNKIIISLRKNSRVCKSMNLYLQWTLATISPYFFFHFVIILCKLIFWNDVNNMRCIVILIMSSNFDS
jgi:hypothetical protein